MEFKYSPRNLDGFGLTDGEVVERLWAYLRRFARMTKEMRPSHRVDVLMDALLHYSRLSVQRLGKIFTTQDRNLMYIFISVTLLPTRMRKAIRIQQESWRTLEDLINSSPGILMIIKATN